MGNLMCLKEKDENAWKQQNMEMAENPAYSFANLAKGGSLIEAYNSVGPHKVREIAESEMKKFFYHPDGRRHTITKDEFITWQTKKSQQVQGTEDIDDTEDDFNKFYLHDACWDLNKRGGVGETPFHLLYLMDSPVHFECANILLKLYPSLSLDVYEGEEYFGESSLHIAIVIGDMDSVRSLVEAGADIHQRATGRFFLPEDQKLGYTNNTNYYGYAYYGEYALAFAACLGNTDIYDYLLDHGADPNLQDSFGNTVLHMVVIADQRDMYKYAVRHHRRRAKTDIKNNQNLTPLTLACKLGRYNIFKEMLDLDALQFWQFSTTMCSAHPLRTLDSVGPDGNTNWDSALMIIVNGEKEEHLEMLEGGVMRQLIDEKWKTFARKRFIMRLIIAILHLTLFSLAIYLRPSGPELMSYRGSIDGVRYGAEVAVCLSCLVTVFHEVTEISNQGIKSFLKNCTHAPAQTVYLISCLLCLACIPLRFLELYNAEDVLLILIAPCAWFFLLFFARGFNEIGPIVVMMNLMVSQDIVRFSLLYVIFICSFSSRVRQLTGPFVTMIFQMCTGDLYRFAIIYIIFLFGFTQGFYFLFRDVPVDNSDVQKFSTLPETVLNLFQMTLGEFKYEAFNFAHYSPLTKIIFALFMILVPILLLNMLIAMMGNTYTQVIQKSEKEWRKQWAKIVVVLERGVSKKKLLAYQEAYSVKLAKEPPDEDERALVVIKQSAKSRAKTRKTANFHWKMLGKEIVRQLRLKKPGSAPFELQESSRVQGNVSARESDQFGMAMLTDTVNQLAWEKDIDLTKGPSSLATSTNVKSPAATGPRSPSHLQNGSVGQTKKDPVAGDTSRSDVGESQRRFLPKVATPIKKKKNLVYNNRVAPLLPISPKEKSSFSDADFTDVGAIQSDRGSFQSPDSLQESLEKSYPSQKQDTSQSESPVHKAGLADVPESRVSRPEFSFSADSSSTTEVKDTPFVSKSDKRSEKKLRRRKGAEKDLPERRSKPGQPGVSSTTDIEVVYAESSSFTADIPPVGFSSRKGHREGKGKGHRKGRDSSTSQLLEMTGSSKESRDSTE